LSFAGSSGGGAGTDGERTGSFLGDGSREAVPRVIRAKVSGKEVDGGTTPGREVLAGVGFVA